MGLSCCVICVILRLVVLIQYRSVTDTHRHTDRQSHRDTTTACTALSIESRGKNGSQLTQVYLLKPMDLATMVDIKSTISHCSPSLISRQRASMVANCYREREISVITTYLKDNAQTPVSRFVVYTLYNELCNKYNDKSNQWSLCLSVWQHSADRPSKVRQTVVRRRSY